jgi:transcriptional regulator with XRE-family HTH domain
VAKSQKQAKLRERPMSAYLHEDVGPRLRARREERGLSLRELARRLGISPSAVSQIETGKSRPSVSTLYSIVTELGMSLDELFSGEPGDADGDDRGLAEVPVVVSNRDSASPDEGERHVQRAGTRHAIDLESGVRWERLTPHSDPDVDFLHLIYDVGGSSSDKDQFMRHPGREYGLVERGVLEVTVGFDTFELGPGDSISFDSTIPHRLRNVGSEPVHAIWFVLGRYEQPTAEARPDYS